MIPVLQIFPEKVTKVYCTFDHITNKEVDDGFKLNLEFENGATAYVELGTYNFIINIEYILKNKRKMVMEPLVTCL